MPFTPSRAAAFRANVALARARLGLTYPQLAALVREKCGRRCGESALRKMLSPHATEHHKSLGIDDMECVAHALGIPLDELTRSQTGWDPASEALSYAYTNALLTANGDGPNPHYQVVGRLPCYAVMTDALMAALHRLRFGADEALARGYDRLGRFVRTQFVGSTDARRPRIDNFVPAAFFPGLLEHAQAGRVPAGAVQEFLRELALHVARPAMFTLRLAPPADFDAGLETRLVANDRLTSVRSLAAPTVTWSERPEDLCETYRHVARLTGASCLVDGKYLRRLEAQLARV